MERSVALALLDVKMWRGKELLVESKTPGLVLSLEAVL